MTALSLRLILPCSLCFLLLFIGPVRADQVLVAPEAGTSAPAAALAAPTAAYAPMWPVTSGRLTSGVGWRRDPFGSGQLKYHFGYDLAVPHGTPVYATAPGVVSFAGWHKGYGWLVCIDHLNNYYTIYGHNAVLYVAAGQQVSAGQPVARAGSTGRSTGPHVHYEIRSAPSRALALGQVAQADP